MASERVFECVITKNKIKYDVVDVVDAVERIAVIDILNVNYKYIKGFLLVLRNSIDILKKEGVKKIQQVIVKDDYATLGGSWVVVDVVNNVSGKFMTIECSIDDLLENYGIGLGIKNIVC